MAIHIGRREFIVTLGGAATWPLAAHAQRSAMPVIAPHWSQSIGMVAIVGIHKVFSGIDFTKN
jgi:hypothetical protein